MIICLFITKNHLDGETRRNFAAMPSIIIGLILLGIFGVVLLLIMIVWNPEFCRKEKKIDNIEMTIL